jgi:hypothetical protein
LATKDHGFTLISRGFHGFCSRRKFKGIHAEKIHAEKSKEAYQLASLFAFRIVYKIREIRVNP